jgi:hypothetical protein
MSDRIKAITVTFLGQHRRMIEWTPDVTAEDMVVASEMCDAQIIALLPTDEDDE